MRFEEDILWSEGLFLQPHHLQTLQRQQTQRIRIERSLGNSYPYGLINYQMNEEAFRTSRVVINKLTAIMPDGEEISMPGNCIIPPLDITTEIDAHVSQFTVFLALPAWSDYDANLADPQNPAARRIYIEHEETVRDENTGDNEISIVHRRFNARLSTDLRDNTDLELLPLFKVNVRFRDLAEPQLEVDSTYIPPYLLVSHDCPLYTMTDDLVEQIKQRINKIHYELSEAGYTRETMSGSNLFLILQLQALKTYLPSLTGYLTAELISPFDLFIILKSLLGNLEALNPTRDRSNIGEYNHIDCAPMFMDVFTDIRSLIVAEGVSSYIKLDFKLLENRDSAASITLKDDHIIAAEEYFLAIHTSGNPRNVISAIEAGDNMKLVNPSAGALRIRGLKLIEMRYPPRFLPALQDTLWFKLDKQESIRVWDAICSERGMILDWAPEIFPELTASLFITCLSKGGNKQ